MKKKKNQTTDSYNMGESFRQYRANEVTHTHTYAKTHCMNF